MPPGSSRVGHARGRGDHRAVAGVDDPRLLEAVGHPRGVDRQRQQVAVAAEAAAELAREARERAAVAQQQVRRAERACAEDQVIAGQLVGDRRLGMPRRGRRT